MLQKFLLTCGTCVLLLGCATPLPPKTSDVPPTPKSVVTIPYTIATLDHVEITLSDGSRTSVDVAQDGNIDTAAGPQYVRGLSKEAFTKLLRRQFPNAAKIEITEYRPDEITVLGEVFHQIHTTMGGGPMRVMDGIASANGFTPLANKRRVKLVRQNAGTIEVYELDLRQMLQGEDIAQNLLLKSGDVIAVPRNFL